LRRIPEGFQRHRNFLLGVAFGDGSERVTLEPGKTSALFLASHESAGTETCVNDVQDFAGDDPDSASGAGGRKKGSSALPLPEKGVTHGALHHSHHRIRARARTTPRRGAAD